MDRHVLLNDGHRIPLFGTGTTHNQGGISPASLALCLELGVRLVDTASRYRTERLVGESIRRAVSTGIIASPDDVFVSSKLWPGDIGSGGSGSVRRACAASLSKLQGSGSGSKKTLDMFLVHWPGPWGGGGGGGGDPDQFRRDVWREMESLQKEKLVTSIGVSNFMKHHLASLPSDGSAITPAVNQIEWNPAQQPAGLQAYCRKRGITVMGYCPLAKGALLRNRVVQAVARKHGTSAAAVLIRWSVQSGAITIPKSDSVQHIRGNVAAAWGFRSPLSLAAGGEGSVGRRGSRGGGEGEGGEEPVISDSAAAAAVKADDARRRKQSTMFALDDEDMRLLGELRHEDYRSTWDPSRVP